MESASASREGGETEQSPSSPDAAEQETAKDDIELLLQEKDEMMKQFQVIFSPLETYLTSCYAIHDE